MADVNSEIWGAPSSWIYSKRQPGLETTAAKLGNFDKPKTANFGTGGSADYEGALVRAINVSHTMTLNEYLDESICPCGQAPDVSPFGKIALMNENKNFSTTPSSIYTTEKSVNWFFADVPSTISFKPYVFYRDYGRLKYQQFAPKAFTTVNAAIVPMNLVPYVKYGLKSLVLSIEVGITANANNPITGAQTWVSLDDWKNNYSTTHYVNGMRLFVRSCTAINSTTLKLTYSNERNISTGQRGALAILNKFNILNDGENVDTQFLALNRIAFSSAYIFDKTPEIFNEGGSTGANDRAFMPAYQYFENQTINFYREDNTAGYYYYKIPYSENNYNKFMQIAALFGCFFTPTNKYVFDYNMLDNDLYLPIIDDNGVTHGRYTRGAENANNPLYSKNSIRDIDYNPDAPPKPVDTNTYSITTGFNTVGNVASTTKQYVINANALQGLSGELWTVIDNLITSPDDIKNLYNLSLDSFLTNNPIDAIVSVKKFPLSSVPHGENLENIYLGKYQAGAAGYPLAMQQARYNFEGIPIFPKFGNCFLDYSPYTKMQLYVPFCGTIDIDAADFMGRTLSVEMVIDFITGTVTAYVLANQLVVTSLTGTCGIDIPITGTEQATVNSAYESAAISERQARKNEIMQTVGVFAHPIKTATKPLTTSAERVSTALDRAQREYELTHINIPLRQIGNASPLNSWALEFVCRLIIYYPDGECITFNATNEPSLITDKVESFGAVNGFATVETNTLSSFTGFTQVSDVDLTGISATDTEKNMILSLLQSGVYI